MVKCSVNKAWKVDQVGRQEIRLEHLVIAVVRVYFALLGNLDLIQQPMGTFGKEAVILLCVC
jgi:hypothetical protein